MIALDSVRAPPELRRAIAAYRRGRGDRRPDVRINELRSSSGNRLMDDRWMACALPFEESKTAPAENGRKMPSQLRCTTAESYTGQRRSLSAKTCPEKQWADHRRKGRLTELVPQRITGTGQEPSTGALSKPNGGRFSNMRMQSEPEQQQSQTLPRYHVLYGSMQ